MIAAQTGKYFLIVASTLIALALFFALSIAPVISSQQTVSISGQCVRVVDGDSLYIERHKPQIRLWGVDAPERNEAGYQRAKDKLTELAKNKNLHCEAIEIDKYDRAVARCYVQGQGGVRIELNRALLEAGVASEYCWFSKGFYGFCDHN